MRLWCRVIALMTGKFNLGFLSLDIFSNYNNILFLKYGKNRRSSRDLPLVSSSNFFLRLIFVVEMNLLLLILLKIFLKASFNFIRINDWSFEDWFTSCHENLGIGKIFSQLHIRIHLLYVNTWSRSTILRFPPVKCVRPLLMFLVFPTLVKNLPPLEN